MISNYYRAVEFETFATCYHESVAGARMESLSRRGVQSRHNGSKGGSTVRVGVPASLEQFANAGAGDILERGVVWM